MNKDKLLKLPYWLIIVIIVGTVFFVLFFANHDKERHKTVLDQFLLHKGEMVIKALETLERSRQNSNWAENNLENFLNNIDIDTEIVFLALTDDKQNIINFAGYQDLKNIKLPIYQIPATVEKETEIETAAKLIKIQHNNENFYLIYKPFYPLPPKKMMRHMRFNNKPTCQQGEIGNGNCEIKHSHNSQESSPPHKLENGINPPPIPPNLFIYVGINAQEFDVLSQKRIRTSSLFISLFGLLIIAGLLALFNLYNSRISQRLYQHSHALTSELMARLPLGLIIINTENNITTINNEMLKISKLTEKEIIGQNIENFFQSSFPQEENLKGHELELTFKNNQKASLAIYSAPILDNKQIKLGQIILFKNLNEVEALRKALAKEERLADLGRMAANLAHEIRNPLGATRGLTQYLLGKAKNQSPEKESLEVMLTSLDRLNQTISNFLDYAKPSEIKLKPLEMLEFLKKLNTLISHDALSSFVEINLILPAEEIFINGDESRLAQAFLNIYLNGIQAAGTNKKGILTVELKKEKQKVFITFSDNGPGFSKVQLAKPFVPYFTTKAEGSGLGLAMVEKIIKAHNGEIFLNNNNLGGGLVSITLNIYEA